jgi:hypothetical protein
MRDLLTSHPRIVPGSLSDPNRVVRAVDGTHVDRASSSLAFAAFLEDCYCRLSDSLELVDAGAYGSEPEHEQVRPELSGSPSTN